MIRQIKTSLQRFTFQTPRFLTLHFSKLFIQNQAYLLLSWQLQHSNYLRIKQLKFKSHNSSGSAYIAIPDSIQNIEIKISNYWHKAVCVLPVKEINLDKQIHFIPPASLTETKLVVHRPLKSSVHVNAPKLSIRSLKLFIPQLNLQHSKNDNHG